MYDQFGNEINTMTKEEADASVKDMRNMMKYFDEICEHCGKQRKNCSIDCIEKQLSE
jgi:Na+-translocating ferredoxin:NAD+ oxidoreductase RNF subunit RnfB